MTQKLVLGLFVLALFTSCGSKKAGFMESCSLDGDCESDFTCDSGVCSLNCHVDSECTKYSGNGYCSKSGTYSSTSWGICAQSCAVGTDCPTGHCKISGGTGLYCIK